MPDHQKGVLLSTKELTDYSISAQKKRGWAFSVSHGTWGWNIGSGKRRLTYQRENGEYLPINDGRWHQLAMTHNSAKGIIRLYFDGRNLVTYNVRDSSGFEFGNDNPLTIGWDGRPERRKSVDLPVFVDGGRKLQKLVDAFNQTGLAPVEPTEFPLLVGRPSRLIAQRISRLQELGGEEAKKAITISEKIDRKNFERLSRSLMQSRYTVHQSSYYNEVARLFKLYRLENGRVVINAETAQRFAENEVLVRPEFDIDELKIWNRPISSEEVLASYTRYYPATTPQLPVARETLEAGAWNIYHGGIHHSRETHGWDSREVIIDLLRREKIDVLMMQETYSSGAHIAAALGYYYATTIDWDNMFQGANISVLSRYPIKDVYVPPKSAFMSVGTKISLSKSQDIFVISSWFGMRNFSDVFQFHKHRFSESDRIPILFGGDFNAVPVSDGGNSPASQTLTENGFVDSYRSLLPDVGKHPGFTHRSRRRIDQLYYKGKGLRNSEVKVISSWPTEFPSDHYLLKATFRLDYRTSKP